MNSVARKMYIILICIFICLLSALCIADSDIQPIPSEVNVTEEKLKDKIEKKAEAAEETQGEKTSRRKSQARAYCRSETKSCCRGESRGRNAN